jgi:hypothetical protein
MTSRAIFLSFISVGCTGLTLAAIVSSDDPNIPPFDGFGNRAQAVFCSLLLPGEIKDTQIWVF